MVLMYDGSSEHVEHIYGKKRSFDDTFDVTKCLQQIEIPDLRHMCASRSELPS